MMATFRKTVFTFFLTITLFLPSLGAQQARLVKLDELKGIIESPGEEIRVINFWATWCGPCIKELPLFEKFGLENKEKDVRVWLVSLDLDLDPNPAKIHRFVEKRKLTSEVLILNEANPNVWIEKIDSEWSGAIPATIVVNTKTGKRKFVERELKSGELEKLVAEVR